MARCIINKGRSNGPPREKSVVLLETIESLLIVEPQGDYPIVVPRTL